MSPAFLPRLIDAVCYAAEMYKVEPRSSQSVDALALTAQQLS